MKISDSLVGRLERAIEGAGESPEPEVSDVVGGRYRLLRQLGAGGMGRVFEAEDEKLGRVAIKLLSAWDAAAQARFAREAALLDELAHPRVVRVLDHGLDGGPSPFLVTELYEGETLADRLKRGSLPLADVLRLALYVCEPLAMVHARGVVHRDIKPSNVFLPGGEIACLVLLDFGLAKALEDDEDLTFAGATLGTPGFMAPELSSGAAVDPRADVFSLGRVIAACVGSTDAAPAELAALLGSMCSSDPEERPRDAGAVARALERISESLEIPLAPGTRAFLEQVPDWSAIEAALLRSTTESQQAAALRLTERWLNEAGLFDTRDLAARLELAGIPSRAAIWYRRAAKRSLAESDFTSLFADVESAIRCGATNAELGGLHLLQAQANAWTNVPREAMRHGEEAMRHLGSGSVSFLRAATEVGVAAARLGDGDRIEEIARLVAQAMGAGAPRWIVACAARLVTALCAAGRQETSRLLCARLDDVADAASAGDPYVASRVALARSVVALFDGDLEAHATELEHSAELVERAGDVRALLHDRTNLGFALIELGQLVRAEPLLESVLRDTSASGMPFIHRLATKNLAMVRLQQGRLAEAEQLAVDVAQAAQPNPRLASVAYAFASVAAARLGAADRATSFAKEAIERAPGDMERARALGASVRAALVSGDIPTATRLADDLHALFARVPFIDGGEGLTFLSLVDAREAAGDPERVRTSLEEASRRLTARAARIRSADLVLSFWAVPEHAEIRRRAQTLGLGA
ncbi:MAG: serine/threonine protein kinase [Polyangiaceae bacterium]|nr:serine/threonine protein kinase [Polyangiaceae bacterium]